MKSFKNKLFYLYSFIIYVLLSVIFSFLSACFIEIYANSFLIKFFAANKYGSSDIIEVVIGDGTVKKYDWPWSKDMYLELFDYFNSYANPNIVGVDIVGFSIDKSKKSDLEFEKYVSSLDKFVFGFIPDESPNDSNKQDINNFKNLYSLNVKLDTVDMESSYSGITAPMGNAAKNYGSVKISDENNISNVFSAINIVKIEDKYYPSLALKMYLSQYGANDVIIDDDAIFIPKTGLKVPYDYMYNGQVRNLIRYYKNIYYNGTVYNYSHGNIDAARIIDTYRALKSGITPKTNPELYDLSKPGSLINPDVFKGKSVLIGSIISGPAATSIDVVKSPMASRHQGVDIQATIYDNLINHDFLNTTNFLVSILTYLLLSAFAFVVIFRQKFLKGLLSIFLIDIIFLILVCICANFGYLMSFATPIVGQFVSSVFAYSFKFITENRNKEKIKQAMGKYLSQDVMKNVVKNIDDLKLGGKRAVVTVLFSDIRGFTSLSEKMSAQEVSLILNEYFGEMEPIVRKYNGVINKFIGDAVMAIFGEPIQDSNHPQNAVRCAYEMLKKVEYLRDKWMFEGKPKIEIGIGINTGEVFIGNIGTETRMEYTVIGDTVNLASRIEGYNKVYKTNLLISSSTYMQVCDIADVIKISEVQIRGKSKKMDIYEVLRVSKQD